MDRPVLVLTAYEQSEHELQIDCSKMLDIVLRPDVVWTAVDHAHSLDQRIGRNGRPIGILEAQKRKGRGVKKGICDYLFWYQQYGFAIELKRSASDPLSPEQKVFCKSLLATRIPVKVCWTKDQVFDTVVSWGLTRAVQYATQMPLRVSGGMAP